MFGSLAAAPERNFTEQDRAISANMLDTWARFVKTGAPDPTWPRADVYSPIFMELGDNFAPRAPLPDEVRNFWNSQYDARGEYRF